MWGYGYACGWVCCLFNMSVYQNDLISVSHALCGHEKSSCSAQKHLCQLWAGLSWAEKLLCSPLARLPCLTWPSGPFENSLLHPRNKPNALPAASRQAPCLAHWATGILRGSFMKAQVVEIYLALLPWEGTSCLRSSGKRMTNPRNICPGSSMSWALILAAANQQPSLGL